MPLLTKVGSVAAPASNGNVTVSGVGFQPKAVIFWASERSSDGLSSSGVQLPATIIGFTDGSANKCLVNTDDFTAGDPYIDDTHCVSISRGTSGTPDVSATLASFNADGFTLAFDHTGGGGVSGQVVNYLALGGTELQAKILGIDQTGATGNESYTGVGFQPDAAIFIYSQSSTPQNNTRGGMGWAAGSPVGQGALSSLYYSNYMEYQRTDRCIAVPQQIPSSLQIEASLASWNSDGFTLNYTASASGLFYALCLKGVSLKIGNFDAPVAVGSDPHTGVGFQPKALMLASYWYPGSTSIRSASQPGLTWLIAGADGTNQSLISSLSGNNPASTLDRTRVVKMFTDSSSPTVTWQAALSAFGSDGFTLNWTTVQGSSPPQILYFAFGDPAGGSTAKSGTDSGAGADASSLAAKPNATDSGTDTEVGTPRATPNATDSGTSSESAATRLATTDSSSGSEAAAPRAVLSATDTGTDSELGTQNSNLLATDIGTDTEGSGLAASIAASDSGTSFEVASVSTGGVKQTTVGKLALEPQPAPDDLTKVRLLVQAWKINPTDSGILRIWLYEGATLREGPYDITLTDTQTLYDHLLVNAAMVGNWSDLQVWFQGISDDGFDLEPAISYIDLIAPQPATTSVNSSDSGTSSESAQEAAQVGSADVNAVTTESASTGAIRTSTDANGATTEAVALTARPQATDSNLTATEVASLGLRASDVNGTTTEAATTNVPKSSTDASGPATEVATEIAKITAIDSNASVIEIGSTGQVTPVSSSDSGHGAESLSAVTAALGGSEGGSSTETASAGASAASSDTGTSTEVALPGARTITLDNGSSVEVAAPAYQATSTDANLATTEAASISRSLTSADGGSSTELVSVIYLISDSDQGAGSEDFILAREGIIGPDAPFWLVGAGEGSTLVSVGRPEARLTSSGDSPTLIDTAGEPGASIVATKIDKATLRKAGI